MKPTKLLDRGPYSFVVFFGVHDWGCVNGDWSHLYVLDIRVTALCKFRMVRLELPTIARHATCSFARVFVRPHKELHVCRSEQHEAKKSVSDLL